MFVKYLLVLSSLVLQFSNCRIIDDTKFTNHAHPNDIIEDQYESLITPNPQVELAVKLIFPGTKWCGSGNKAGNYDNLGSSVETDKCCRQHDTCNYGAITSGETMFNLTNTASFSRLNCKCDEVFRKCLQNANTESAKTIGYTYFNVIGTQCFRKDYKVTGCARYSGWLHTKCVEYTYDKSSEPQYQWFDVPNFYD